MEHDHVLKGEQQNSSHSYALHVGVKDGKSKKESDFDKLNRDGEVNGNSY